MKQIVKIILIIVLCITSFDASAQTHTIRRGNRTQQTQQQQPQRQRNTQSTEEQKYNKDLKEGESLVEAEKYSEAKRHFTIMYAKYPKHEKEIERWLEVCEMFMVEQEERRQQELEKLNEIEAAYQNDMELGEQYISERQYEKALSHFQAMLSEYSEFPDYCYKINDKISRLELLNTEVFVSAEILPEFPGGESALMRYISRNLCYPEMALANGIQGRVVVKFVVEKDGSVSGVTVVRGVHEELDREAVRVVKSMPKWQPGKSNGQAVRCWFNLPLTFKIQQQ